MSDCQFLLGFCRFLHNFLFCFCIKCARCLDCLLKTNMAAVERAGSPCLNNRGIIAETLSELSNVSPLAPSALCVCVLVCLSVCLSLSMCVCVWWRRR